MELKSLVDQGNILLVEIFHDCAKIFLAKKLPGQEKIFTSRTLP